jgi:acyl dehydratase
MSAIIDPSDARNRLVSKGETVSKTLRFTREDIMAFARMSEDNNPLHYDLMAAQRAQFGEIIASGQHSAALLIGMLATHFSRNDDGVQREMLCLNMNFSFKGPVFADQEVQLRWVVADMHWNSKLRGMLALLDGTAMVTAGKPAVIARGTILVKEVKIDS